MADLVPEDLAAVASLTGSIFAALLVAVVARQAQPEVVRSRGGWLLVGFGVLAFAARVLGHFSEAASVQEARRVLGMVGAVLVMAGFWSITRAWNAPEPARDEADPEGGAA